MFEHGGSNKQTLLSISQFWKYKVAQTKYARNIQKKEPTHEEVEEQKVKNSRKVEWLELFWAFIWKVEK